MFECLKLLIGAIPAAQFILWTSCMSSWPQIKHFSSSSHSHERNQEEFTSRKCVHVRVRVCVCVLMVSNIVMETISRNCSERGIEILLSAVKVSGYFFAHTLWGQLWFIETVTPFFIPANYIFLLCERRWQTVLSPELRLKRKQWGK